MNMKELMDIAKDYPWFSQYLERMPDAFAERLEVVSLKRGETVIRKGFEHPYIYFLLNGMFVMQNEYFNGRNFSYAEQSAPGFCGLLEYFAGQLLPTTTIKAGSKVIAIRMKRADFASWVERDFPAYKMVTAAFARQMYPTMANQCAISAYSKKELFVNYIISRYSKEIREAGICRIPAKREDMALLFGASVRTVYRIQEELREEGLISIDKKKITVNAEQLGKLEELQFSEE